MNIFSLPNEIGHDNVYLNDLHLLISILKRRVNILVVYVSDPENIKRYLITFAPNKFLHLLYIYYFTFQSFFLYINTKV